MRHLLLVPLLCALCTVAPWARAAGPPPSFPLDATLTVGDTTIRFPHELEAQAKEVAKACEAVVPSRLKAAQQFDALQDKVASRVVALLGCPEHAATVCEVLRQSTVVLAVKRDLVRDIRLYREADLLAAGGLHEGCVSLAYRPETDRFSFSLDVNPIGPGAVPPHAFLPVPVRRDGTIGGSGRPFAAMLTAIGDSLVEMAPTPAHEATEIVLLGDLSLRHPFARWFNEGVGNWVAWQVVQELAPEMRRRGARPSSAVRAAGPYASR